jgi:hypothetical protein
MRISATITTYEFDSNAYNQALKDYLNKEIRLAAREFASTALSRIPIRTGFVAGAFAPLTELVGGGARLNPVVSFTRNLLRAAGRFIANESFAKRARPEYYRYSGGKIIKNSSTGRVFATPQQEIFKDTGGIISFNFQIDISYFRVNDTTAGHAPTAPWGAFTAGQEAFLAYINNQTLKAIPIPANFVKSKVTNV